MRAVLALVAALLIAAPAWGAPLPPLSPSGSSCVPAPQSMNGDAGCGVMLSAVNYATTHPGSWQTVNGVIEFVGNQGGFVPTGGFEFLGWDPNNNHATEWLYIGPEGAWEGEFPSLLACDTITGACPSVPSPSYWDPLGDLAHIKANELPCLNSTPLANNGGCQ